MPGYIRVIFSCFKHIILYSSQGHFFLTWAPTNFKTLARTLGGEGRLMLRRSKLKAWPAVLVDVIIYSSGTVHFCMLSLHPFNLHNKSWYGIDHYQSYRSPYFLVHDPSLIRSRCCLVGCRRHSRLRSKTHAKKVKAQPSPVWLRLVQEGAFTFFVGGRAVCHNKCQVFISTLSYTCATRRMDLDMSKWLYFSCIVPCPLLKFSTFFVRVIKMSPSD